jgi:hypothetical protein
MVVFGGYVVVFCDHAGIWPENLPCFDQKLLSYSIQAINVKPTLSLQQNDMLDENKSKYKRLTSINKANYI